MTLPIRGEIPVTERGDQIRLFTADGSVDLSVIGLNSVPRVGETVEFAPGRLYRVEHVRWSFPTRSDALVGGTVVARILIAPTADPLGR
ncbi:hypothetical protein FHX74_001431 [Friedmanniella endophytica]|uniref:Uncharacterized protein n=1 Tax=Microlunatus kandeliicorticis TaxID=1759536 RepID=A0A7W3IRB3_9ACTN|nr:hypothetical protein [Microlunatus kandeliicorticis]MBA8793826.1 hypothetical protein [Microlunatus kandeliicorticis]